jgi:transmembrane sensor
MDDLAREIAVIRDELNPEWDEARSERLLAGVGRLQTRRRTQRLVGSTVLGAAAAAVVALGALELVPQREPAATLAGRQDIGPAGASLQTQLNSPAAIPQPTAAGATVHTGRVVAGQRVHLADGSWARIAAGSGALAVRRNEAARVELQLERGLATFDVVPNTARTFVVDAGAVQVHVLGTVFEVERTESHVRVSVTEGKVRVQTPQGPVFVPSGDSVSFDVHGARERAAAADVAARSETAPRPSATRGKRAATSEPSAAPSVSWRSLCQSGDYESAYRMLEQGESVDNDPAALMDAADAARFSGHAEASVAYLRRVLREHRASPVAALAGFTLGRVLLERLGQPSEAAEAFALARGLAPSGSLAQDALAREVEAWSKAGNSHEAYQRAQQYVESYPNGRRLRAVQIYGGLE